jgi:hypothetical protein
LYCEQRFVHVLIHYILLVFLLSNTCVQFGCVCTRGVCGFLVSAIQAYIPLSMDSCVCMIKVRHTQMYDTSEKREERQSGLFSKNGAVGGRANGDSHLLQRCPKIRVFIRDCVSPHACAVRARPRFFVEIMLLLLHYLPVIVCRWLGHCMNQEWQRLTL